ncbi:MAG: hypothetical protein IT369_08105, partial [Candidatus Latescibacteria bacterium]|nr:hypothetical protein [Candidatus Latescibacterota bacterium]
MSTMRWVVGALLMIFQVGVSVASEPAWSDTQELRVGGTVQGRVEMEIRDGWLHVRRFDTGKELVWEVVLCRAEAAVPPVVRTDGALEVRDARERYFIRELVGTSRVNGMLEKPEAEQLDPQALLAASAGDVGKMFDTLFDKMKAVPNGVDTAILDGASRQAGEGGGVVAGIWAKGSWEWVT